MCRALFCLSLSQLWNNTLEVNRGSEDEILGIINKMLAAAPSQDFAVRVLGSVADPC